MRTNPHIRFLPIQAVLILVTIQGITPDPCDLASHRIFDVIISLMSGAKPVSYEGHFAEACESVRTSTVPFSERLTSRTSRDHLRAFANPFTRRIEIEGIALIDGPPARSGHLHSCRVA